MKIFFMAAIYTYELVDISLFAILNSLSLFISLLTGIITVEPIPIAKFSLKE